MINQIMSFIQIGKSATGVFLPILADPRPTATICADYENRFRAMKISGKEPVGLDQKNPIELMQPIMTAEIEDCGGMGDNLSKRDK